VSFTPGGAVPRPEEKNPLQLAGRTSLRDGRGSPPQHQGPTLSPRGLPGVRSTHKAFESGGGCSQSCFSLVSGRRRMLLPIANHSEYQPGKRRKLGFPKKQRRGAPAAPASPPGSQAAPQTAGGGQSCSSRRVFRGARATRTPFSYRAMCRNTLARARQPLRAKTASAKPGSGAAPPPTPAGRKGGTEEGRDSRSRGRRPPPPPARISGSCPENCDSPDSRKDVSLSPSVYTVAVSPPTPSPSGSSRDGKKRGRRACTFCVCFSRQEGFRDTTSS